MPPCHWPLHAIKRHGIACFCIEQIHLMSCSPPYLIIVETTLCRSYNSEVISGHSVDRLSLFSGALY